MRINFLFDNWVTGKAIVTGMDIIGPLPSATADLLLKVLFAKMHSGQDEVLTAVALNLLTVKSPELKLEDGGFYMLAVDLEGSKFGVTLTAKTNRNTFIDVASKATGLSRNRIAKII